MNKKIYDRGIVHATFGLIFANAIFLTLNIVKGIAIAYHIGVGADMDAFVAVDSIPTILLSLLSGAFLAGIVPELTKIKNSKEQFEFCNSIISITLVIGLLLLFLLTFFSRSILMFLYSLEKINVAVQLSYLIFPIICTGLIFHILKSIANTHKIFFLPALTSSIYILSIILCLVFLTPSLGVLSMGIGVLIGSFFQSVILLIRLRIHGFKFKFHINLKNPHLVKIIKMTTPLIIGSVLVTLNIFIDRIMASRIGTGYISALHYGYIPLTFILSFFTVGLSISILPYLSDYTAKCDVVKTKHLFCQLIRLTAFITFPIVILFMFLARPIIEIMLQRGAFTVDDTSSVVFVFKLYALGLPFAAINTIIIRFSHAMQQNMVLLYVSIPYVLLNVFMNWIFIPYLEHGGIALSTTIDYLLVVSALYIILNRILGQLIQKQDIMIMTKTVFASIPMVVFLFVYTYSVHNINIVSRLVLPCILAISFYISTAILIKHQDLHSLMETLHSVF